MSTTPDAGSEIRMLGVRSLDGANYWSRSPVTRVDVAIGRFDEISSAEVDGLPDRLLESIPGLLEHRCSVGIRGGLAERLRRGTYAPHVLEHIALELQTMVGHEVGFGRTRAAGRPAEYTVVFRHLNPDVGLRAAAHALAAVQDAFAGRPVRIEHAVAELRMLAEAPPPVRQRVNVNCGVTGSTGRVDVCHRIGSLIGDGEALVEISPAYLLNAGLPYHSSEIAVILDAAVPDVPSRFRDSDRAAQLVSILADAVGPEGYVVAPSDAPEVAERVLDAGRRVALFTTESRRPGTARDDETPTASIRNRRIVLQHRGASPVDLGPLSGTLPPANDVAATLAAYLLKSEPPFRQVENDS